MDDDGELYEFAEDWGEKTPYFVLTGFNDRKERLWLEDKIQHLGGELLYDVTWNDHITHVISKSFASTELVLGGLAAGRWVLTKAFIEDSYKAEKFLIVKKYVHDESVVTHKRTGKGSKKRNL